MALAGTINPPATSRSRKAALIHNGGCEGQHLITTIFLHDRLNRFAVKKLLALNTVNWLESFDIVNSKD